MKKIMLKIEAIKKNVILKMQPENKKRVWVKFHPKSNFVFAMIYWGYFGDWTFPFDIYTIYDYCNTFYYEILYKDFLQINFTPYYTHWATENGIKEYDAVMTEIKFSGLNPLFSWLKALNSFEILKLVSFKATV